MTPQLMSTSFYDMNNVVTIRINMPPNDWWNLMNAQPHGGWCNFGYIGDRFDWYHAISVEISGSVFPTPSGGPYIFYDIGISKKSYCGSFSNLKPSLRLNFSKYSNSTGNAIKNLIGTHFITLNNCIQDPSYVKQPLGYHLFKQAGLPYSRCNFADVYVNTNYHDIYLSIEPIKKPYIQNNFNNNDQGNLYELEKGDDFTQAIINSNTISFEGFSNYSNKQDLQVATTEISNNGLAGMTNVIDTSQFLRFCAMEILLKHWDGYTGNLNNTFIYNDTVAVPNPTTANVEFKFIPWGLDQILLENQTFHLNNYSVLAPLILNDATSLANLKAEIRNYSTTIFDRDNYNNVLTPFINQMQSILSGLGLTNLTGDIDIVRHQLKLVKSGGFQIINETPSDSVFLLDKVGGNCIHASNTEFIGAPGGHQEVYHYAPTISKADRWYILSSGTLGRHKFTNKAYGRFLHASGSLVTSGNNLNIYNFLYGPDPYNGNEFIIEPLNYNPWDVTGYFKLKSYRTSQYIILGTDLTLLLRTQVHQIPNQSMATILYLF